MSSAISLQSNGLDLVYLKSTSNHGISTKVPDNARNDNRILQARKSSSVFSWKLMSIPAFLTAAYALNFLLDIYRAGDPAIIERIRSSVFGVSHIVGGLTAMGLGPFQFLTSLRKRKPSAHIWIGRIYVGGIIIGSVNAFYVSFTSLCRPLGQYAFAFLGLIWLVTATEGMRAIWAGKVARHREWMTRNFALTYAAVMLRWQLPLFIVLGMGTEPALTLTGFTSWIPNLIFAEWWIKKGVDDV